MSVRPRAVALAAIMVGVCAAASQAAPVVKLWPTDLDLGKLIQGQVAKASFRILNTGDEDLHIAKVRPSCAKCLRVTVDTKVVPPDDYTRVDVVYLTREAAGRDERSILVETDDPGQPVARIRLTADVDASPRPEIEVETDDLQLGLVRCDAAREFALRVRNVGKEPLSVEGVTCSGPLTVLSRPTEAIGVGQMAELRLGLMRPMPEGPIRGAVLLRSDDPVTPVVTTQVTGFAASRRTMALVAEAVLLWTDDAGEASAAVREVRILNGTGNDVPAGRLAPSGATDGEAAGVQPGNVASVPLSADNRLVVELPPPA